MIGIDTNVLIRLLTKDNEAQYQVAHSLFKENRIFITDTVFLEAEWVLGLSYNYDAELINDALTRVLGIQLSQQRKIRQYRGKLLWDTDLNEMAST